MTPLILAENLTLDRQGRPVLRGASLRLMRGERLAIVGPNGAGKTSLLRALVGLTRPETGRVALFGADCAQEEDFRKARKRLGFLFQESDDQLFCPTVLEDVAFGPLNLGASDTEARATAAQTLARLGLAALTDRLTHQLSGGEKRLVCLAGLWAMGPEVLLLDEPTNGVDRANGALLEAVLRGFSGAMILVSHDDAFVSRLATRAMLLESGALLPAEIHSHPHLHAHPHLHRTESAARP